MKPLHEQHPIRGYFGDPRTIFIHSDPETGTFSFHNGVDIVAEKGTKVYPVRSGVVVKVDRHGVVVASGGRRFQYRHIEPRVRESETVYAGRTVLGTVEPRRHHLHLAEVAFGVVQNPLRPGHLTPYRDPTPPRVDDLYVRDAAGGELQPDVLAGEVDLVVRATDVPSLDLPGPWAGVPVSPARISWQIQTTSGAQLLPEQTAVNFLQTEPKSDRFWDVYASGTYQNFPVIGKQLFWGAPGDYLFNLTPNFLDTRLLPAGTYVLTIAAYDTCGNRATLGERIRILPQPGQPLAGDANQPGEAAIPGVPTWPDGRERGWTVVLASIPLVAGTGPARATARDAVNAGLRRVGVIDTDRYPNLHPGYLVVFSGVYADPHRALTAAAQAGARFPGAYPREVVAPPASPVEATSPAELRPRALHRARGRYTVVLVSAPVRVGRSGSAAEARRAITQGFDSVRVLDTARFRSLRPGYFVVVSGRFRTAAAAQKAAARAAERFPGAYPRKLVLRRAASATRATSNP